MKDETTPTMSATTGDDPLAVVRPGDPDPFLGRAGMCGFRWFDHLDEPGLDQPWRCHRDPGHLGQHIATAPGSHVTATYSARPDAQ